MVRLLSNNPLFASTVTVLADGNVLNFGGSWSGARGGKNAEIFDMKTRKWTIKNGITPTGSVLTSDPKGVYRSDNHFWMFTAPNKKV